jgi:formyltetrahydrofolate synthetase
MKKIKNIKKYIISFSHKINKFIDDWESNTQTIIIGEKYIQTNNFTLLLLSLILLLIILYIF